MFRQATKLTQENNTLVLQTPYDAELVALIKGLPFTDRRWDGKRKAWLIDPRHATTVHKIVLDTLGENLPALVIQGTPAPTIRTYEIRYLGTTKPRDDGSMTALGWTPSPGQFFAGQGGWDVIFPEDTLRRFFEGVSAEMPLTAQKSLYGVLGVVQGISGADLKNAWRRLARQWHPDVCREPNAAETFMRIQEAYEILSNPATRARYDAGLALEATLDPRAKPSYYNSPVGYRSPLRCGIVLVEGIDQVGRFLVKEILAWEDITNDRGQTLVTSWPAGADGWVETWV